MRNGWTARLTALTEPSPIIAKPVFLPRDDGAGLHECQGVLPGWPQAGEPGPEESISWPKLGPRDGVVIDGQLMPECHVFEAQGCVGPEVRHDVSHQGREDGSHRWHPHQMRRGREQNRLRSECRGEAQKSSIPTGMNNRE